MPSEETSRGDGRVVTARPEGSTPPAEHQFGRGIVDSSTAEVDVLGDPQTLPRSITASAPSSEFAPDKEALGAMSPQERVDRIRESVERSPRQREILYQALVYCQEPCSYEVAEGYLQEHPAWNSALQAPRILLDILVRAGGIEVTELDEDGSEVTEGDHERVRRQVLEELEAQGVSEEDAQRAADEASDDLVSDWRLSLSAAGVAFVREYHPANRLRQLIEKTPSHSGVYRKILDHCQVKRTLAEVCDLLPKEELPTMGDQPNALRIQPSTFINRLEIAGGLTWEGGWKTTEDGVRCLALLKGEGRQEN